MITYKGAFVLPNFEKRKSMESGKTFLWTLSCSLTCALKCWKHIVFYFVQFSIELIWCVSSAGILTKLIALAELLALQIGCCNLTKTRTISFTNEVLQKLWHEFSVNFLHYTNKSLQVAATSTKTGIIWFFSTRCCNFNPTENVFNLL